MSLEHLEQELSGQIQEDSQKKRPFFKWVLIFFIACFLIVIIGGGFLIWSLLFKESSNVSLLFQADKNIMRGIPFEITAVVTNEQDIAISDAKLSLSLPDGIREADTGGTLISEPIGTIQGGVSVKRTFSLISVNEKGTSKNIEGRIAYTGANNNRFEPTPTTQSIEVTSEPLTVAVSLPDSIIRGAPFSFEIQFANKANVEVKNLWLAAEYPDTFHFDHASIDPDSLNNKWKISSLKKDEVESVEIFGTYEGDEETPLTIPVSIAIPLGDRDFVIASSKSSKEAQPSPVMIDISVNGSKDYIAKPGDTLAYNIQYENRTGIALKNVVVTLSFSGDMANVNTLTGIGGIIDKKNKTIEWSSVKVPELELVGAGAKGELSATIKLKDVFPIKKASDKNFSVVARTKFESPSVPSYYNALKTTASASIESKIGGSLDVASEIRYRDPDSGLANSGPFPPKIGQSTEYTIHWVLETGATDIKDCTIIGELEDGVTFAGVSKSNIETKPEYDSTTNSIKWKIPHIPSGRGVISDVLEATFQVRATPRTDQIKQFMPIMKETIATGIDEFTGLELSARDVALSTSLPDDETVGAEGGRVVQ